MVGIVEFWDQARQELAGLPGGAGLNIAHEAVDRHVAEGNGERIAIRWIGGGGASAISATRSSAIRLRFANALKALGVGAGDRVFSLLGRIPELHIAAFGTWKLRAVFCPLFSAFGPEPVKARMLIAKPVALVTTSRLFARKIQPILGDLPFLKHIIIVGGGPGGLDFEDYPLWSGRVLRDRANRA